MGLDLRGDFLFFFKTVVVVVVFVFRVCVVSCVSLLLVVVFSVCCLVWGLVLLFLCWVWKVLPHVLHLHRGFPFVCLSIFTIFELL